VHPLLPALGGGVEGAAPHVEVLVSARRGDSLVWLLRAIQQETDDCILWPFGKYADGYACLGMHKVHRLVLRATAGEPSTDKAMALHSCDVRECVNPRHLRWGSALDNFRDAQERDRVAVGERHGNALLTVAQVEDIRAAAMRGITGAELALRYGVSQSTISAVVRRKNWRHLT
jgi:hypothetical protein